MSFFLSELLVHRGLMSELVRRLSYSSECWWGGALIDWLASGEREATDEEKVQSPDNDNFYEVWNFGFWKLCNKSQGLVFDLIFDKVGLKQVHLSQHKCLGLPLCRKASINPGVNKRLMGRMRIKWQWWGEGKTDWVGGGCNWEGVAPGGGMPHHSAVEVPLLHRNP